MKDDNTKISHSRRNLLAKASLGAVALYMTPAFTTLSMAQAASGASGGGASGGSSSGASGGSSSGASGGSSSGASGGSTSGASGGSTSGEASSIKKLTGGDH